MHSATRRTLFAALAIAVLPVTAPLLAAQAADSTNLEILPLEEETALALSAAPEHLRDGAGVEALTPGGFVTARESTNGFTCVVNRDHPLNRKPTCYDAEGTATILPKVEFVGTLLLRGVPVDEINRRVAAKFEAGEFISPRRPGVAYMLSKQIRNYNPRTGEIGTFPPHIMFYAPNITSADIGTTGRAWQERKWLPFVAYQGPQGYMIVVVSDDTYRPPAGGD